MIVWRAIAVAFADSPLSTEGARRLGGRWHPPGVAVLYTASAEALASLERFVHLGPELKDSPHVMLKLELPDGPVESVERARLPRNWRAVPAPAAVQAIGGRRARRGTALALVVPSALSESDHNILLNAAHPLFQAVRVLEKRPFVYDPRMWKVASLPPGKAARRRRRSWILA